MLLFLDTNYIRFVRPKVKVQQHITVHNVVNEFSAEFSKTPMNELFCKLCECVVTCSKKFFVDSHNGSFRNQEAACECVNVYNTFCIRILSFYFGYS